jgi:glycosyltransferase involved in cell wall biosynthesis
MSARVLDIELGEPLADIDLGGRTRAYVLLRYAGRPVGRLRLECPGGWLGADQLRAAVAADQALAERLVRRASLAQLSPAPPAGAAPSWTVIVCTRDRTEDLARCLNALQQISTPGGEILVVDNAPSSDATELLARRYAVRYVREDRPGLNWARAHGVREARGEIVIFTDDDVVVEPGWVAAILEPFAAPRVAAVTGLTMPLEQETAAQELFETYGGFGRGFERRIFDYTRIPPAAAGMCGAGANMAFRRELATSMAIFEAELDCGTPAETGGDAYAFYRLLADGHQIIYTPDAVVWHRHRRDYAALRRTLAGYSVGGFAFLIRCLVQHGDWQAVGVAGSWFYHDHLQQLKRSLLRRPGQLPLDLVLAQITACPRSVRAYLASTRRERAYLRAKPAAPILTTGASGEPGL